MRIEMSKIDYLNEMDKMIQLAIKKEMDGFEKFGSGIAKDYNMIEEIEQEIADSINYLVMGMYKIRKILDVINAKIKELEAWNFLLKFQQGI